MKKLLIIEDDQIVANIYRSKFQAEGFEVETAPDGERGLQLVKTFRPNGMLLDLMLPGVSGLDVLRQVRAQPEFQQLPVIVFSNTYLLNMVQEAWKAGATKCLSKASTTPRQVIESVRNALTSSTGTAGARNEAAEASAASAAGQTVEPEMASADQGDTAVPGGVPVRQAFIDALPPTIAKIRASLKQLMKSHSDQAREKEFLELAGRVHAITGSAAAAGFRMLAEMSDALEALVSELRDKPRNLNASTLRTMALAIDCIGTLFERGLELGAQELKPANILVVDDEPISRRAIISALEKARLKCVTVEDPRMAETLLANSAFDLVLLDIDMPGMTGYELCSKLRSFPKNKSTPVVFVTALTDFENRAQSMVSGGNDFIAKPFLSIELAVRALVHIFCGDRVAA